MELEAVGVVAVTEGLLLALRAARQMRGAIGDVEAAAMPLEHGGLRLQRRKDRVRHALGRLLQRVPADFRNLVSTHRRAQHMRQQLRAQADPEDRLALFEHAFDGDHLVAQVRALRMVFHVHRPTQHDQAAVAVDVELGVRMALEILEADPVPALADQRIERAQRFGGDVLEDEEARHAVDDGKGRCLIANRDGACAYRACFRNAGRAA